MPFHRLLQAEEINVISLITHTHTHPHTPTPTPPLPHPHPHTTPTPHTPHPHTHTPPPTHPHPHTPTHTHPKYSHLLLLVCLLTFVDDDLAVRILLVKSLYILSLVMLLNLVFNSYVKTKHAFGRSHLNISYKNTFKK